MRMPRMTGVELLEQVQAQYPQTLRFILSGQFDQEATLQTVKSAHQCIAKPCDVEELCQKLNCALAFRDILENASLKKVISQIRNLPSLPSLYVQLMEKLDSPSVSIKELGEIIERDMAMSTKILQLVNSAFFGLGDHISSPMHAVSLLGTEVVKALVLSLHVFSQLNSALVPSRQRDWLWKHSIQTSWMCRKIAESCAMPPQLIEDCFLAACSTMSAS